MIEVWGQPFNCSFRVLWMLEECKLDYVLREPWTDGPSPRPHLPPGHLGGVARAELVALNPNGRTPVLVDGDDVVWESLAINLYLAMRYPSALSPADAVGWGHAFQWSEWATSELDGPLRERLAPDRDDTDPESAQNRKRVASLERPLAALEEYLVGRAYLAGADFGVVDLNTAAVAAWLLLARIDLEPYPNLGGWLARCCERPAARSIFERALAAGRAAGVLVD